MISSIGTPNPVTMRKLLDYLAQKKRERLAKASKPAERPTTHQQPVVRA